MSLIKKEKIKFDSYNFDKNLISLIKKILRYKPEKRLSLKEIENHKYLKPEKKLFSLGEQKDKGIAQISK